MVLTYAIKGATPGGHTSAQASRALGVQPLQSVSGNVTRLRGRGLIARNARLLQREPLCRICKALGLVSVATEVDHIVSLFRGGKDEEANLQPLCVPCHHRKTVNEFGLKDEYGTDGWPLTEQDTPQQANVEPRRGVRR